MTAGTRAERQAQTRETLIAVARELFLADGFGATSLDRVAVEAGFSKGAVYSNFNGKEELGLAVLDNIHAEQVQQVIELVEATTTMESRLDRLGDWAHEQIGQPRRTALEVELATAARSSPVVANHLAAKNAEMRAAIAMLIQSSADQLGLTLELPADRIATILLSLGIGLGAQRSIDPSVDVDVLVVTLRRLIGAGGS